MNNYYVYARLIPVILTFPPLGLLYYWFFAPVVSKVGGDLQWFSIVGNVSLPAILLYLFGQLHRILGKEFFEGIYFRDQSQFPTTDYLLHKNNFYNDDTKNKIRDKIKMDYQVELFEVDREKADEPGARKQIVFAIGFIKTTLNNAKNTMVARHNIEYGFARNLIGGSLVALTVSVVMIVIFKFSIPDATKFSLSCICAAVYLLPVGFSKWILNRYSKYYAQILFEQYLLHKVKN